MIARRGGRIRGARELQSEQNEDETEARERDRNKMTKGEIVVVTGSSGCLGHQTVKLLIGRDELVAEIRCLDLVEPVELMQQELDEELRKLDSTGGARRKAVKFIRGDIRDINIVEQALAGASCVMHCAARQDFWLEPRHQNKAELESINVSGTENLLKTCVRLAVPKFVHVSSFESFVSYHTIYYATESTIPEPKELLFGPSASTKRQAELLVNRYANVKLKKPKAGNAKHDSSRQLDSLRTVIVRFTPIYGEFDQYFVTKLLKVAKFFGGKLQRFTNIWIRQQPIYVGNAAWSLLKANRRLDHDESISGEEFHITDETPIGDPFDFLQPFVEARGMTVSKSTLPAWPIWFLLLFFAFLRNCLSSLDIFGLFTQKKSRLDEAIELDERRRAEREEPHSNRGPESDCSARPKATRWYHLVTPQTFYFICNSLFLNRTKASLRLDYEPLFSADEAMERSLAWYKNHMEL